MRKTQIQVNKLVYSGLSVLGASITVMYEHQYGYVKTKSREKGKLWYMNTDSFIVYIKADDIYKGIVEGVEKRFDNSNYELDRQLPRGKNKKIIELMKKHQVKKVWKYLLD